MPKKKFRIAILDGHTSDIGIKLLFPEADYYVYEKRNDYALSKHGICPKKNSEYITDSNYDMLFIIFSVVNTIPLFSYIPHVAEHFKQIIEIINANNFKRVVLFSNCDYDCDPNIVYNHYNITKPITFFKRNFSKNILYGSNVFSFPYVIFMNNFYCIIDSIINHREPVHTKVNRLFFSGAIYTHVNKDFGVYRDRKDILMRIQNKIPILYISQHLDHPYYLNELASSKFCLDVVGAGDPNLRTFEILHSGSLLISQITPLVWNFEDGDMFSEETIFEDENDLFEKLNKLNSDELYQKCLDNQMYIVKKYMNCEYMRNYIINKSNI